MKKEAIIGATIGGLLVLILNLIGIIHAPGGDINTLILPDEAYHNNTLMQSYQEHLGQNLVIFFISEAIGIIVGGVIGIFCSFVIKIAEDFF